MKQTALHHLVVRSTCNARGSRAAFARPNALAPLTAGVPEQCLLSTLYVEYSGLLAGRDASRDRTAFRWDVDLQATPWHSTHLEVCKSFYTPHLASLDPCDVMQQQLSLGNAYASCINTAAFSCQPFVCSCLLKSSLVLRLCSHWCYAWAPITLSCMQLHWHQGPFQI
jgi:hypothetical protein